MKCDICGGTCVRGAGARGIFVKGGKPYCTWFWWMFEWGSTCIKLFEIHMHTNTHNDIGDYITAFVSENMDYTIFSLTVSLSCMEILRAWESHTNRNRLFISRWVVYVLCCTYKYSAGCQLCVYFPVFFNYQQHWWKIISLFVQFLTLGGTATQQ